MIGRNEVWSPVYVLRVSEVIETSTRPIRVETDDGAALAKYCGNRQGLDALCSELIAAELLRKLKIDSPDFAIVDMEELTLPELGLSISSGPAFLTRWESAAITFSGAVSMVEKISNPEVITKILVFDTWIKNTDRFVPTPNGSAENLDNLLFVPDGRRVKMMVIDHSHSFTETTFDDEIVDGWWDDKTICGMHPSFATFVREDVLHSTLDEISAISRQELAEIMERVPQVWGLKTSTKDCLVEGLERRAMEMKDWLPAELLAQPPLSYEMGKRV